MPRRLLVALFLSLAVLLAVMAYAAKPVFFPTGNPRITRENFERIKQGMRQEEVEAILEGPPGDYQTVPAVALLPPLLPHRGLKQPAWKGDGGVIWVWVDDRGIVVERDYVPVRQESVGFFDLLLWRWDHWRESRR
jgi:hypothetical protein